MTLHTNELYEPMIYRDAEGIRAAIGKARNENSSREVLNAIVRFAVLAFCPSQHSKAALLAAVATTDLAEALADHLDALTTALAIYAADSRAPWSEPPIGDPPALDEDQRDDLEELREAVQSRDRLRAERWIAKVVASNDAAEKFFQAAAVAAGEGGQGVSVATSAWRIAEQIPPRHRFATLRVAADEWTNSGSVTDVGEEPPGTPAAIFEQLVKAFEEEKGSPLAFQSIAAFDAALQAEAWAPRASRILLGAFSSAAVDSQGSGAVDTPLPLPIYPLGKDYAAYLQATAIAERQRSCLPEPLLRRMLNASARNLKTSESFAEMRFA